uniref:Sugar phosphate transporter domain-containing protein n=1 Tax=Arcella intermedia TaxID=1963864 RepID=A0A6B2L7A5_9EUKA
MFGADVAFYVVFYAFVSATMLVSNKWALVSFPHQHLVMLAQFASTAVFVRLLYFFRLISPAEGDLKVDGSKLKQFIPVVVWFYLSLVTNLTAMKYLSVDLITLIRTCTPFLVAFGDYFYLGRSLPSAQSWFSLCCLALVTFLVFVHDTTPKHPGGLVWGLVWYLTLAGSMVFTRKFITDVKMTTHDRVFWNNVLCIPPGLPMAFLNGDLEVFFSGASSTASDTSYPGTAVTVSCLLGIAMAYAGWLLRARVSALTFTLIGVLCKIGSITINAFFLDHLSVQSMILIVLGIIASTWYEEPKARVVEKSDAEKGEKKDDEDSKDEKVKVEDASMLWRYFLMGTLAVTILFVGFFDVIFHVPNSEVTTQTNKL